MRRKLFDEWGLHWVAGWVVFLAPGWCGFFAWNPFTLTTMLVWCVTIGLALMWLAGRPR